MVVKVLFKQDNSIVQLIISKSFVKYIFWNLGSYNYLLKMYRIGEYICNFFFKVLTVFLQCSKLLNYVMTNLDIYLFFILSV